MCWKAQIPRIPELGNRVLLVVLSTNAPPVPPIRAAAEHARLAQFFEYNPDVFEAWEAPSITFDLLLKALTDKLPLDNNNHHVGQVILLSGDVHHSFASRLLYRGTNRYGDDTPTPTSAVIAQLVASPFKKETASTRDFHRDGYLAAPAAADFLDMIQTNTKQFYAGWNVPSSQLGRVIGKKIFAASLAGGGVVDCKLEQPTIQLNIDCQGKQTMVVLKPGLDPDYRYRFEYLNAEKTQGSDLNNPPIGPVPAGSSPAGRKEAARKFHQATLRLRRYRIGPNPMVVGVNNFGEITFVWPPGPDKTVNHTLRWWLGRSALAVTTYSVKLNPKDLNEKVEPEP